MTQIAADEVLAQLDFAPAGIEAMPRPPRLRESPLSAVAPAASGEGPLQCSHDGGMILAATFVPAWFGAGYVEAEAASVSVSQ